MKKAKVKEYALVKDFYFPDGFVEKKGTIIIYNLYCYHSKTRTWNQQFVESNKEFFIEI